MDFTDTLAALQEMIGENVSVVIGHANDPAPMTAYFSGVLRRGHDFSPQIIEYLDPSLADTEVIAFLVGGDDEGRHHAFFFLARNKFVRALKDGPAIGIEVGGLRIGVERHDD